MKVTAYKTHKIQPNENLFSILDKYLPSLKENTIVAIASKVVGLCEGRVVKIKSKKEKDIQKTKLAEKESEYYLPKNSNKYDVMLTINEGLIVVAAGVDESNVNGYFSLWPKDPQKSVNKIREYLAKKNKIENVGVILTDSKLTPLRWGVTGYAIAYSGFQAINNYIGKPDIFGKIMYAEKANVADSLASATVVAMGEGNEQQPIATAVDVPFVTFQKRNPTQKELEELKISLEDDIYSTLLKNGKWKKGGK